MDLLEEIKERLIVSKQLYDDIRIIDPINKYKLTINNSNVSKSKGNCYQCWNRKRFCENCVSMRAYNHKDTL